MWQTDRWITGIQHAAPATNPCNPWYDFVPNVNITAQTNLPDINAVIRNHQLALFEHTPKFLGPYSYVHTIWRRTTKFESTNEEPITLKERLEAIARKEIHLERNEMTEEQFDQLSKLIYKNLDLFATELTDLVGTDIVTHNIDTGDSPPIRKRP